MSDGFPTVGELLAHPEVRGLVSPGELIIMTLWVASSHRANLRQWSFSPRCHP